MQPIGEQARGAPAAARMSGIIETVEEGNSDDQELCLRRRDV
jgi:hypothetical protein